ncbi:MAG: hypothetical protein ACI8Y7_000159 [Candidatus Woesearchaeota archaeon]|jgi:hypothetical protein
MDVEIKGQRSLGMFFLIRDNRAARAWFNTYAKKVLREAPSGKGAELILSAFQFASKSQNLEVYAPLIWDTYLKNQPYHAQGLQEDAAYAIASIAPDAYRESFFELLKWQTDSKSAQSLTALVLSQGTDNDLIKYAPRCLRQILQPNTNATSQLENGIANKLYEFGETVSLMKAEEFATGSMVRNVLYEERPPSVLVDFWESATICGRIGITPRAVIVGEESKYESEPSVFEDMFPNLRGANAIARGLMSRKIHTQTVEPESDYMS